MLAEQNHTTTITIQTIENGTNVPIESPIKKSERRYPNRASYTTNSNSSNHNTSGSEYTSSTPTTTVVSTSGSDSDSKSRQKFAQTSWVSFQDNLNDNYLERGRRINGLQLPLHPLQISGWVALFGFGVSTFCVLIPALHPDLQAPLFIIVSSLYIIHGCSHVAALLIDPSDSELRKHSSKRIVPEFDRTKHAHVIENGRCHLCNIKTTNSRTKHCSVCNKCVAQFDHHCKWLNHCVGGRNYVAFLMCVVSAVIAAMVILAAVVAELVLYYMKSEWLNIWSAAVVSTANLTTSPNGNDTLINSISGSIPSAIFNESFITAVINDTTIPPETVFNVTETIFDEAQERTTNVTAGISLHDTIFLTFISIIGILAAITVGLLLHLCFFHVYISFLGLTTYEYIRNQRHVETQNQSKKTLTTIAATTTSNNKTTLNALKKSSTANQIYFCSHIDPKNLVENHSTKAKHRPKSIYCCDASMQYDSSTHTAFYFCSVLHDRPSPILVPSSMAHELTLNSSRSSRSKTFHCCSEYKQIVKVSGTSSQIGYSINGEETVAHNDETMTETSISSSVADEYVKFMEQCTFCSFKLKSKMKKSKVATIESNAPQLNNHHQRSEIDLKAVRKPKWNCCSNVPESPDSEISVTPQIDTISASIDPKANRNHIHHRLRGTYDEHKLHPKNGAKSMNSIAKLTTTTATANGSIVKPMKEPINRKNRSASSSSLSTSLKSGNRSRATAATQRTWPIRIRHMLRMFGRCQQPHYPNNNSHVNSGNNSRHHHRPPSPRRHIKQNQVRPMDIIEQQCEELQQQRRQQSSSSSSSSSWSSSHDTTRNHHLHKAALTDRDDILENNNLPNELVTMKSITTPAPPPPVRRKISSAAADMQELAESLSFVQNPSHHHHHYPSRGNKLKEQFQQKAPSQQRPILAISRKRRKNIFRSPNLSPIHESGYSNPTSPKPCRHGGTQHDSESSASTPKISHQYQ